MVYEELIESLTFIAYNKGAIYNKNMTIIYKVSVDEFNEIRNKLEGSDEYEDIADELDITIEGIECRIVKNL